MSGSKRRPSITYQNIISGGMSAVAEVGRPIICRPAQHKGNRMSRRKHYCSFCGKHDQEVKKMILGPCVFVCDECVWLFVEMLRADGLQPPVEIEQDTTPRSNKIDDLVAEGRLVRMRDIT
jgi:ribosomal protein L37AE/L43A